MPMASLTSATGRRFHFNNNINKNYRKGIAALVLCAAVILLLLISLILKSLAYKGDDNGDEKKAIRILCRSCCYVEVIDETEIDETGVPGMAQ